MVSTGSTFSLRGRRSGGFVSFWPSSISGTIPAGYSRCAPGTAARTRIRSSSRQKTDFDVPELDFLTWHGYPVYEGVSADQFDHLITDHCSQARAHAKPVLMEEFGNARTDGDQAAIYARWLGSIESDSNCAGWIAWRLVSRQDDGQYPVDEFDKFDIHNDGGSVWRALQNAATRYDSFPAP